jgi:hypothetical protein
VSVDENYDVDKNMCDLIINGETTIEDVPIFGTNLPLMVDYYKYTLDGKSQLTASATIFNNNEFHLIDMMALGQNKTLFLNTIEAYNEVNDRYGIGSVNLVGGEELVKYPNPKSILEIQARFYTQIEEICMIENVTHSCISAMVNTPRSIPFRTCPHVYVNNFLKYFEELTHLPPKLEAAVGNKKLSLEEFVKLGIDWIKNEKGYHSEFHVINDDEEVKCDNWASLEEQGVGNCKNMAITMFQFCSFYFPGETFYLCSCILADELVPHAICVTFVNNKPFIIDATRIEFEYNNLDYLQREYKYFVTLFPKNENPLCLVNESGDVGITVDEFYNNKYTKQERSRPTTHEKHVSYIYKFKYNNY